MEFLATYYDGQTADPRAVQCRIEGSEASGLIAVRDIERDREIAHWPTRNVLPIPGRRNDLILTSTRALEGARLVFSGRELKRELRAQLPGLAHHRRKQRGRQLRVIGFATVALASVIVAYIYGVPLMAGKIVPLISPQVEEQIGDTVVAQLGELLQSTGGMKVCDPDPNSVANAAIRRFADVAVADTGTPFALDIQVIENTTQNAFALPGGRAFYFSGLLNNTNSADEFAGVLAHEIGHVVHRHGMEQLVATASTGLLVGFILGDPTGLSIAGVLGAALIDTSFSRDAEREADQFAVQTAHRLQFEPAGLADLLDRVTEDDGAAAALALLSTHPLTQERRVNLDNLGEPDANLAPAFTDEEWQAIKNMCEPIRSGKSK